MANKDSFYGKTRPQINSLLSIWYGVLVGGLNVYLIVQSVKRFVWLAELSWPYQKTPFVELNAYIALTGVSVLLLPFFLAASILKVGNTSNDNLSLGESSNHGPGAENCEDENVHGFFRVLWKHGGPTASLLHIISSFSLLLPQTIMEAVLAKYGHLPQDTIWRTDLDFMMSQRDRNVVLSIISTGDLSSEPFDSTSGTFMMGHTTPGVISMEYLNYALALIVFSIRYPTVFWRANKAFALVFSGQLLVNSIHSLMSYSCFTVLYKLHVVGPAEVLHKTPIFLLNNHVTLLLYIISAIALFISSGVFYHYGYLRLVSFARIEDRANDSNQSSSSRYGPGWAFFPHCSALAVLLSLAATQTPVIYDATLLYKISLDTCMVSFVTSSAIHILFWILAWLWLTSKSSWNFQVKVLPECIDGKSKKMQVKKLESELVRTESVRTKRVAFFDADEPDTEQKYFVARSAVKPSALDVSLQEKHLKDWPGPCQEIERQRFLEPEESQWLKVQNLNSDLPLCRNKVTFQDEISSPRYEFAPMQRAGSLKKTDDTGNPIYHPDIGEYALLKGGPPRLERSASFHHRTSEPTDCQKVPASIATTDSGYSGGECVSRSDSRSTTGSRSPPYRQMGPPVFSVPSSFNATNPLFELNSEEPRISDSSPYGKLGLGRRESMKFSPQPIYEETKRENQQYQIYESRRIQQMSESPYGVHPKTKSVPIENYEVLVNDIVNPIYGFSKQSKDSLEVSNNIAPSYYGNNTVQKLQELEKTFIKTSENNFLRDSFKCPKRNNSFRQSRPSCENSPANNTCSPFYPSQSTVKIDSFPEPKSPPIPPPLPPLSLLAGHKNANMLSPFSRPGSSDLGSGNNYDSFTQ